MVNTDYCVTRSSHFTMPSMTAMETKQTTAKTAQQYLIGHALYITGPSQIIRLPMAVAPSHKPWHKPTMWRGATLETNDRPSGDMNNSATVSRK